MMHILKILSNIKKMPVKELKDFLFITYYGQIGFAKENCFDSMKHKRKRDLLLLATKLI